MSNILISWYRGTLILVSITKKLYILDIEVGDLIVVYYILEYYYMKMKFGKKYYHK